MQYDDTVIGFLSDTVYCFFFMEMEMLAEEAGEEA
jgi:hypothetical protein